ncbi:hypothetical protein NP493_560g01040 [Ridgeia piscesae]|uniref:C-type lectin domain-containing protein n=1 Tax=Ridgeia piscesae TaxID=27915 RepID=A0AAD9NPN0_RIDPI|nr:hypothetical protein NP493_560g01040 [Ridgeia piscesae]
MRATMVEDRDSSSHSFLRWKLKSLEMRNHHHLLEKQEYWLGATDLEVERRFRWDPSYTYVTSPTYWMYGNGVPLQEPNNYLGYQNCMAIKRRPHTNINSYYYDWIDDDCYQKKFYICERRGWFCWGWQCFHRLYRKMPTVDIPRDMTAEKMAVREVQLKRKAAEAKAKGADTETTRGR